MIKQTIPERLEYIRNGRCAEERSKTYDGVALRVGFGSINRMILALRFQAASSSSLDSKLFALRFFGRNGGGVLGRDIR